jgi:hypothetical protein
MEMASRETRRAFWTVSRVSVLRVRFGIPPAWHETRGAVKGRKFQIDPLPWIRMRTHRDSLPHGKAFGSTSTFSKYVGRYCLIFLAPHIANDVQLRMNNVTARTRSEPETWRRTWHVFSS